VRGALFVQIGEDNEHLVRALLDEVIGAQNFVSHIVFRKTSGKGGASIDAVYDSLLWYARDKVQTTYKQLYAERASYTLDEQYAWIELPDGARRRLTTQELEGEHEPPRGRRFKADGLYSESGGETTTFDFVLDGKTYSLPPHWFWKTNKDGMSKLAGMRRLIGVGKTLCYVRYADDFPFVRRNNLWDDTMASGYGAGRFYVVQTSPKVIERCISMTTHPGDIVFDPTCGGGTTAAAAERLGRRWITCDTSRVAVNVARERLLSLVHPHFVLRGARVSDGFRYKAWQRVTLGSITKSLEPKSIEFVDTPEADVGAIRVTGPFEVASLGRYSVEDWKGYVVREPGIGEAAKLENYIEVICRLYRKDAAIQGATGLVHAVSEDEKEKIAISVGPLSGRVTAKQINDAVQDALASGILEVHVLGWAFEANVGEVKSALEKRGKVKVELIMIRPDTLAEGLKATQPEMLFSPLALPDVDVAVEKNGTERQLRVTLKGVALFDRKRRTTEYKSANSGYVSAWYLDEDYDGDCFVDCQMFFDFKKTPNIKAALKADVDPEEFTLKLASEPFPVRGYKRVAVKVVDVYGNESTVVKDLG